MNVEKYIDDGGVFIKPKCFSKSEFIQIQNKLKNLKLKETHQPLPVYFGNRYQAYPCYESDDKTITELMKIKITELFGRMIKDFNCVVRKTISKELEKSKVNTKYGLIHTDDKKYACVLHLDQTTSGGTGLFINQFDKYPDIEIGSQPNRMIIYSGKRNHAPAHDYTFMNRTIIAGFWN